VNEQTTPPPPAQTPGNTLSLWTRFRATFGPAVVGLLGGALTVGFAFSTMPPILRACGETYAKYPSLQASWLMQDFTPTAAVLIPFFLLAVAAPFVMGLVTARLVRPKDRWEAVSAGLTTAATASFAAYVLWIGWAATIATVIVPSISDFTLFGQSTRAPAGATAHPSDVLTETYPDLKATPADARGDVFFPKIVSDQVVGSAFGVWYGVITAVAAVGVPGLCGTLAGAWLLRRAGGRWAKLVSYLELTVATSVPLGLLVIGSLPLVFPLDQPVAWLRFTALVTASAVVVAGVVKGWGWPVRVVAAVSWGFVLFGAGLGGHTHWPAAAAAYAVYGGLALLLVRQSVLRAQLPSATRLVMPA
jgi:hypothetical protein